MQTHPLVLTTLFCLLYEEKSEYLKKKLKLKTFYLIDTTLIIPHMKN